MQVTIDLAKMRAMEAEIANTKQALMQTQQMLLTVIYAQPLHTVTLTPADFENLPNRPVCWQQVDSETGDVMITVSESGNEANHSEVVQ